MRGWVCGGWFRGRLIGFVEEERDIIWMESEGLNGLFEAHSDVNRAKNIKRSHGYNDCVNFRGELRSKSVGIEETYEMTR